MWLIYLTEARTPMKQVTQPTETHLVLQLSIKNENLKGFWSYIALKNN